MNYRQRILVLLALAAAWQASAAGSLPRIFFTPAERAAIVARRATGMRQPDSPPVAPPARDGEAAAAAGSAARNDRTLRVDGISVARGGRTFAWIDGERYASGARLGPWRLQVSVQGVTLTDASGNSRLVRVGGQIEVRPVIAGTGQ